MRSKVKLALLVVGALSIAACPFAATATEQPEGVFTLIRVLVGQPQTGEAGPAHVLVVPGPFVFLGKSPEQDARDVLQLIDSLKRNYALADVTLSGTSFASLAAGADVDVPVPGDEETVRVGLVDFDAAKAVYRVTLAKRGDQPTKTVIVVNRGERGLIGTRDGSEAPFLFLDIEPVGQPNREAPVPALMPKLLTRVLPVYPEEARKARIEGVVILEAAIGTDGAVHALKAFRSEPMGLTEAAEAAVKQWRYEPARDAAGRPVAVVYAVTVVFRLDHGKPPKAKK